VISGTTVAMQDEVGLTDEERANGFILTCVRRACESVELDLDDLGDIELPVSKTLPCRIQSLERLSYDVLRVMLRLAPGSSLNFLPGQYVDVIGSGGLRRSYSIANARRGDEQLELHIREVPDGEMSNYWFRLAKTNDLLRLRGPLGTFFLRDQADMDLVMLATGTGIAPVKSILEGLVLQMQESQPRSVTVYWGGRRREDHYLQLPEYPRLRFVPVLSRADASWLGARGHVQDVMLTDRQDFSRTLVFACGSTAMIHNAQAKLHDAGLPARQFRSDAFVCSATT
jgi:CDP-4-dehydro-6-deoxyglucose reductase